MVYEKPNTFMVCEPKRYEELTFTDDFMFCKIMQSNEKICKELLELILDKKIKFIQYPEKQKSIEITSDGKGIRLDIYVEDDEKSVYDVEMQTVSARNLPKRSRYYQGMIDLNLIERGADYEELRQSYIIFICLFDCFGQGLHKYTFTNRCEEFPELKLDDGTKKIFLCADGDKDDVSTELKQFLKYLVEQKTETEFTKEIDEAVKSAGQHEKWRSEYMTLLMRDQENRKIGMEIGREEGREEGREQERIEATKVFIEEFQEEGFSKEKILDKLEKRFNLSRTQAEEYFARFSKKIQE